MSFSAGLSHQDPALASLFATSSGPVIRPKISKTVQPFKKPDEDEESSQVTTSSDSDNNEPLEDLSNRPRKRRRMREDNEDLEAAYFNRIAEEELEDEQKQTRSRIQQHSALVEEGNQSSELESSDSADVDDEKNLEEEDDEPVPRHETLDKESKSDEAEKLKRTVFLGNVSTTAIKTKHGKTTLIQHLRTGLDSKYQEKIESIRFRSTAFANDVGPKRAAYAKKELMDDTTKSTHAYVVLSTDAAARKLCKRLNGSVVLDRHLKTDYLGEPNKIDHRRCVFVGNLSFVNEESVTEESEEGTTKKKKAKEPADVEEGLWQTFGKVAKLENVRVVRDQETRVSKGFAYVQFEDQNGVEKALLLNEKKFPPMLPRKLRVMRAKQIKPARGESKSLKRNSKVNGRYNGRNQSSVQSKGPKRDLIFEGQRATSNKPSKDVKVKKRPAVKPTTRSSRRGAAFKAAGGKRKRAGK